MLWFNTRQKHERIGAKSKRLVNLCYVVNRLSSSETKIEVLITVVKGRQLYSVNYEALICIFDIRFTMYSSKINFPL